MNIYVSESDYYFTVFNSFEEIENYNKIIYICCDRNNLTTLPKLPNSIQQLWCNHNQLTSLPKLPNSLQYLNCSDNQLRFLPELPNSLKQLTYYNNKFIKIQSYKYLKVIVDL